ncbi:MAG: glycosyltransferase family 39 protein [Anaerolineae bacterium]
MRIRSSLGLRRLPQAWRRQLIVLGLVLLGAALRLPHIGTLPPGLYHDEAQHGLDALDVLQGDPRLYFEANNGREPLYIYLVAIGVKILGRNPIAVRVPAALVGILTLAAAYDLGRTLWGSAAGRWTLAVLGGTFWHVHLSRVGFRAVLLPLFTALTLAQAAKGVRTQRRRHWIAAGALYGTSWYTYMAARFSPVAIAALAIYGVCWHRDKLAALWRPAALAMLMALLVLLPLGIYTLAHPDIVLGRSGQVSIFSEEINEGHFWRTLGRHLLRTAGMFTFRGDRIWRHNLAWRPVWGPALGVAFVWGVGIALARFRHDAGAALVLLWTLVMAIPTLLAEDAPHFLRGVGVLPTAALLSAAGLGWLSARLGEFALPAGTMTGTARRYWARRGLAALPVLLVVAGYGSTLYDYFVRYQRAPLTYHWFEAGPVKLAGEINTLRGEGWDGDRMRKPATRTEAVTEAGSGWQVFMDRQIWDSWIAIPFLVPEKSVSFLPVAPGDALQQNVAFVVWPYRDWEPDVLPHLPHPAYIQVREGPRAQGDLDPEPVTIAMLIEAAERPEVPEPVARFEGGIILRAALVQTGPTAVPAVLLWWETEVPIEDRYTVFVHYLRDGARLVQDDGEPGQGHLPTTFWQPGDLILDIHPLAEVVPDPQQDRLRVGLYDTETMRGLQAVDEFAAPVGDAVELPLILTEQP